MNFWVSWTRKTKNEIVIKKYLTKIKYFSLNSNAYGIPHAIVEIYEYLLSIVIESTQSD